MIIRGIIQAVADGAVRLFSGRGRPGEQFTAREFLQHYGFASRPKAGAEMVVSVEGNVITCIGSDDRRYRIALAVGEIAIYDDRGQFCHIKQDDTIHVKANQQITLDAPLTYCTGDLLVEGGIDCRGEYGDTGGHIVTPGLIWSTDNNVRDYKRTMQGDRDIYNGHHHGSSPVPTEQE
jgi:phage gp45-like